MTTWKDSSRVYAFWCGPEMTSLPGTAKMLFTWYPDHQRGDKRSGDLFRAMSAITVKVVTTFNFSPAKANPALKRTKKISKTRIISTLLQLRTIRNWINM